MYYILFFAKSKKIFFFLNQKVGSKALTTGKFIERRRTKVQDEGDQTNTPSKKYKFEK
jgi:hypothetical protein